MSRVHKNGLELRVRYGRPGDPSESLEMYNSSGDPLEPCQIDELLARLRERIFWGETPYPLAIAANPSPYTYHPLPDARRSLSAARRDRRIISAIERLLWRSILSLADGSPLLYYPLIRELWDSVSDSLFSCSAGVFDICETLDGYLCLDWLISDLTNCLHAHRMAGLLLGILMQTEAEHAIAVHSLTPQPPPDPTDVPF